MRLSVNNITQCKVQYHTSGNKSQTSVIGISAAGQALPPFVIFNAKSLNMDWTIGQVAGTTHGLSDNGWVDMHLLKEWFSNHFQKYAVETHPPLLLDGNSLHYNPETV